MNYRQATEIIKSKRKNRLLAAEQAFISALKNDPSLRELDIRLRTLRLSEDADQNLISALEKQETEILQGLGINLNPPPYCLLCGDTGNSGGKPCACIIAMTAGGDGFFHTFDECDFSVFSGDDVPFVKAAYDKMRLFCDKFPATNKTNVMLCGGTGTGKTFLASCVASYISEKGYSVVFLTAFEFVNRMLHYHTAPVDQKLEHINPILDCDLLIIDDLGSENILKNVTVEYLYNVINERLRHRRHTLITTNLDDILIEKRYGLRIASRLFDKRTCLGFALAGKDVRKPI